MSGFFSNVQYSPGLADQGWLSQIEKAADVCRAPRHWLVGELWGSDKKYLITQNQGQGQYQAEEIKSKQSEGIQKALRIALGIFLSVPGEIIGGLLMVSAFTNEEIRLKHQIVSRNLTEEERNKLNTLINQRQTLAKERQGCEPISCLLLGIFCLLCCLVCCKN